MDEDKPRATLGDDPGGNVDEFNEMGSELGGEFNEDETGQTEGGINEGDEGLGSSAGEMSEEVGGAGEMSEEVGGAGEMSEEVGEDMGVSKAKTTEKTSQTKNVGQSRAGSFRKRCSAAWATMKDFCIRHKRLIIGCVLVIVLCIIGYVGYRAYRSYRSYRLQQDEKERQQQERERHPVASDSDPPPSVSLWKKVLIILGLIEAPVDEIKKPEQASASDTELNHSDRPDNIDAEDTSLFSLKSLGNKRKEDQDLVGDDVGAIAGTAADTIASIVADRNDADDGNSAGAGDAGEEVFNVSNNIYTYSDARAVCKALGARLATPAEVRSAYTRGADWCTYGWSEGKHALYPTQKASWKKLQKNKKRKHDCGLPGVNGGYFENPDLRFGANCYGKKPSESVHKKTYPYDPDYISEEESRLQAQIDKYRNELEDIEIAPYNRMIWSILQG